MDQFKNEIARFVRRHGTTFAVAGILGAVGVSSVHRVVQPGDAADAESPSATVVEAVASAETEIAEAGLGSAWDLPNLDHPRVDYWVERFSSDPAMREKFEGFLERSGRYVPMISERLTERGMPQDLIYLAMIESGFQPKAYSPARASGLWQFIGETGQRYGLTINRAIDERNDPVRATEAALDYLTELHERFGSWYLASAAYNTGENRVGRIMREEFGSERGDEYSYYRIANRLPRETRDYVPLMIAAARITKDPAAYGFDHVVPAAPYEFEEVEVAPATSLAAIARAAGVTVTEIGTLNPHLKMHRTPNNQTYHVRLPVGTLDTFQSSWGSARAELAEVATAEEEAAATRYRVRRGDNLTAIARRHGVSIQEIRRANGLRGDFIRAGQVLEIPGV